MTRKKIWVPEAATGWKEPVTVGLATERFAIGIPRPTPGSGNPANHSAWTILELIPFETGSVALKEIEQPVDGPVQASAVVPRLAGIDEVIFPEETRSKLIRGLELLKNKRQESPHRKHGNIPL